MRTERNITRPRLQSTDEPARLELNDGLDAKQQRLLDRSIELILELRRSVLALSESHQSVQALVSRNAAVTIDNIFGSEFRAVQPLAAAGEDHSLELGQLTAALENLVSTFEMLVGQIPVRPRREPTKVTVPQPTQCIALYRTLLQNLVQIRETRLRWGTQRIDVMLQLMQQLYVFWEQVHPLVVAPEPTKPPIDS